MDGRYAPSPTGSLHLGNLRTALVAWLFARAAGSRFVMRVDDLDSGRSRERYVAEQLGDLRALELTWDGEPLRPSARAGAYDAAIAQLRADGLVYECWCTRAEIREAASAPHGALAEGAYPGTCRELSAAQRAEREAGGRPAALRVRAGGAEMRIEDRLAGTVTGVVDDFVVRRNDGDHAYNLAVVVDDAEQGVQEVVRGADLLDSTPRQAWLAQTLGLTVPAHAHVALVVGDDGRRLAKRHGAVTLAERAAAGEDALQTRALLARSLGLAAAGETPTLAELLARFDPAALPAQPTVLAA
ncbi:MAG: glutamyl-tRNA synthetase [Acidimicrobiaceae bacterium]